MRFHILGIPHTVSTPEYSSCAFTGKVVKLCKMLTQRGHEVIHYGHQDSDVLCTEHVTVTKRYDLDKSYKDHDWRRDGWPKFDIHNDWAYKVFASNAVGEIATRRQPHDFLLLPFGFGHKAVADELPDMIQVEPGIGYPDGGFAPFRIFESYAVMHAYQGKKGVEWAANNLWYDAVIPNYFDIDEFAFEPVKQDYFLFLGRVNQGKGVHIAAQIAKELDTRLIVAGSGEFDFQDFGDKVERVGVVEPVQRRALLSAAKATLCPSTFMEPFCGTQVESFISGTPVISSDRGAFAEYNVHGVTGYRCRTFEHFVWAARNIAHIKPVACRRWGIRFSLEAVGAMYEEYFQSVLDIYQGKGWYEPRPDRADLDYATNNTIARGR